MTLENLTKEVVKQFQCTDGIKVILYDGRIEFFEITDEYTYVNTQLKEITHPTSYHWILTIYLDTWKNTTKITSLESGIFSLVTKANHKTCEWLSSIVEQEIIDYSTYEIKHIDTPKLDGYVYRPDNYEENIEDEE